MKNVLVSTVILVLLAGCVASPQQGGARHGSGGAPRQQTATANGPTADEIAAMYKEDTRRVYEGHIKPGSEFYVAASVTDAPRPGCYNVETTKGTHGTIIHRRCPSVPESMRR